MIGQRRPPTCSKSQRYGSGFHGSPVVTRIRSDERSASGSPCGMSARTRVGERPSTETRSDSTSRQRRSRGPIGRPLREDERAAQGAAAHDGPRAHDPAHVGGEVEDVLRVHVGLVGDLAGDRDEETALDVQDSLRLPGRAGGVGEEIRMLGVHLERLQLAGAVVDDGAPARVPLPGDDVLDGWSLADGLFHGLSHREARAAPQRVVGGDDDLRLRVAQALDDGRRREAGEERHLHGADVRAGVRGDRNLRAHGQVDGHAVARLDAEADEALGEPCHVARELREGQLAPRAVLTGEDRADARGVALGPPVHAVPRDRQRRAGEPGCPFRPARVVADPFPRLGEVEPEVLDDRGPEPLRLLLRAAQQLRVALEAVPAHEPGDVRMGERRFVRCPDHLGHGSRSLGGFGRRPR